jgi:hypothetical protein
MPQSAELNIRIEPHHYNDGADLTINDRNYLLTPVDIKSEADLRSLLQDEPDYIYNAVVGLCKAMAS